MQALEEHRTRPDIYFYQPCLLIPHPEVDEHNCSEHYHWAYQYHQEFVELKKETEFNKMSVDYFILSHIIEKMVPHIAKMEEEAERNHEAGMAMATGCNSNGVSTGDDSSRGRFVISHPDLHFGNIFVDDDFNITGIIDWSAASTGSLAGLLASPMFRTVHKPQPALMAAYREGFRKGYIAHDGIGGGRTTYSSGHTFPAAQWKKAEMLEHFQPLISMGIRWGQGYCHFRELYKLIYADDVDDEINVDVADDGYAVHDTSPTGDSSTVSDGSTVGDNSMTDDCNTPDGSDHSGDNISCDSNIGRLGTIEAKEGIDDDNDCDDNVNNDYDYDLKMLDVFHKHRELPYAKAELARLDKEDEEAEKEEEEKEEDSKVGLSRAVAYKLVVMESMNANFIPDRRLWQWIAEALADQTEGLREKHRLACQKRAETYKKEQEEKKKEEEKIKEEDKKKKGDEKKKKETNDGSKGIEVKEGVMGDVKEATEALKGMA